MPASLTAALHRGGAVAAGESISVGVSGRVVQYTCHGSPVEWAGRVRVGKGNGYNRKCVILAYSL